MNNLQLIDTQNNPFYNALITEVEFKTGEKTKMITLFNTLEIGFEEVNLGVKRALECSHKVKSMHSSLCTVKSGIIKENIRFEKQQIKDLAPEELFPNLANHL